MTRRQFIGRIGQAAVVGFFVVLVTFLLVRVAPGDPARGILGSRASAQAVAALHAQLHLNEPLWRQFADYMGGLIQGDLGQSLVTPGLSVASILGSSLPVTLQLIACTLLIATLIGVPLGLLAGASKRSFVDAGIRGVSSTLLAAPPFLLALALILALSLSAGIFPPGGWDGTWPGTIRYVTLPSLALAGFLTPLVIRTVRQGVIDVSREPFTEAAIARGLTPRAVLWRHILPNSLVPLITLLGLTFGSLVGGAVVVEAIFNLPGIGSQLVNAVNGRDYPVIQGIALVTALIVVAVNLVTDISYSLIDPRTRQR